MAIFDELKSVAKTLREADKIEQYQQILDVQEKLIDIEKRNYELENENRKLKEKLVQKETLIFERNAYWTKVDERKDGPFCSRCYDVERNLVRIKLWDRTTNRYACPECKHVVSI